MTASSFGASLPGDLTPSRPLERGLGRGAAGGGHRAPAPRHRVAVPLLLAAGLVLGAVLLAPEQPRDQEAICHRHNGVEACRVW
ncbi:hypothetical protein H6G65_02410 [Microcystis elabens FACHB-917]|nr:hypothetical protein [Microcystis elabens FACHB-917]